MTVSLFEHQKKAISQLKTGSILCGGVGSGKSLTALVYYYTVECGGKLDCESIDCSMKRPKDLFIITPAFKRDTLDWENECAMLAIGRDRASSMCGIKVTVDSWNNIKKYIKVKDAFFIFDEQRVIGSGSWVRSFLKIVKNNNWILLSATPGDTWIDYIPAFVANKFYKNRTEFLIRHVVYNHYMKFPKVDHYVEEERLEKLKKQILVQMAYEKKTVLHWTNVVVSFDKDKFNQVIIKRWNPFRDKPIKNVSEYCYVMRKVINSDPSRINIIRDLVAKHRRLIVFYNFNYELDLLRKLKDDDHYLISEFNGHKHEQIPESESWIYLVQYISGSEGWNCIQANAIVFYSQNYSYRMMTQAAGRIDRINTPFVNLYYYTLKSTSAIDVAIGKALKNKKNFNERLFASI